MDAWPALLQIRVPADAIAGLVVFILVGYNFIHFFSCVKGISEPSGSLGTENKIFCVTKWYTILLSNGIITGFLLVLGGESKLPHTIAAWILLLEGLSFVSVRTFHEEHSPKKLINDTFLAIFSTLSPFALFRLSFIFPIAYALASIGMGKISRQL